jgi:hypothetical protein
MKKPTKELLKKLRSADWFRAVGQPASRRIIVVSSWKEAILSAISRRWGNCLLEVKNELWGQFVSLSRVQGDPAHKWNAVADRVGEAVKPIVKEKIKPIVQAHKELVTQKGTFAAGITFPRRVTLDIEIACLEQEYSELIEPRFGKVIAEWYMCGHFPCGWEGRFPKGKLVIY